MYIINYSLINITWDFFGSHLINEEQHNKHFARTGFFTKETTIVALTHAPIITKVIGSAVRAS